MAFQIPPKFAEYIAVKTSNHGRFTVRTFTVCPLNGRRGPDDETYQAFPELIELVPRGFSDLYIDEQYMFSIRGLNKFDGTNIIDEDDFEGFDSKPDSAGKNIFPAAKVANWAADDKLETRFVEKANGKFAIFQLFEFEDKLWIFGGSKNRHVVYEFATETFRTDLHDKILAAIIVDLKKLTVKQLTSLINQTIVGEYVDGMHLVWTESPYLVYFNVPVDSGLPTLKNILPISRRLPTNDELGFIRTLTNIEGVVIEYRNTESNEIVRQKHKTEWYIIWRCFREILSQKSKATSSVSEIIPKLQHRLQVRSDQFLRLPETTLRTWYGIAEKFVEWMQKTKYDYKDCSPFSTIGMATLVHEFVNGITDSSTSNVDPGIEGHLIDPTMYRSVIAAVDFGLPVVVIMAGPSLLSKGIVLRKLIKDLEDHKICTDRFSTNDYFTNDNVPDPEPIMNHLDTLNAFSASRAQVRIVDNTNLTLWGYANYNAATGNAVRIVLHTTAPAVKKNKPTAPSYYGLFPLNEHIEPILKDRRLNVSQKTPLHVTTLFVGCSAANNKPPSPDLLNRLVDLKIVGYSKSSAGDCLITECDRLPGNHITLSTHDGFKPVDVGKAVDVSNTTLLSDPPTVIAIYLPYF